MYRVHQHKHFVCSLCGQHGYVGDFSFPIKDIICFFCSYFFHLGVKKKIKINKNSLSFEGFLMEVICQKFKAEVHSTKKLTSLCPFVPQRCRSTSLCETLELDVGLGLLSSRKDAVKERRRVQCLRWCKGAKIPELTP